MDTALKTEFTFISGTDIFFQGAGVYCFVSFHIGPLSYNNIELALQSHLIISHLALQLCKKQLFIELEMY